SLIAHFGAAMNVGAHAVDIGHIPSIALKNLEVLRDGAAAQYGSDAIAGVFNFILKDADHGAEIQAQTGKWYGRNYGSETDYKVAANFGLPLTKKGFINVSGEYTFNEELQRGNQHAAAVGLAGAPDPVMNWGRPESSGFRGMWNAGIELTENVDIYSFGNYADTYGNYSFFFRAPNRGGVLTPVPNDPQDPSKGNFSWGDAFPLGFTPRLEGFQKDFSSVTGIKGTFGDGINYDISASFGHNRINYLLNGTLNPSWGPYSQRNFAPGDLQQEERNFNVDLSKELSDKVNLAVGYQSRNEMYTMFEGDYQSYAAGPWAGVGNLVNPETGENYATPAIGANGLSGTTKDDAGVFESKSWGAYADLEIDITEAFLLQLAYRHEDYKEFGGADNFKIAGRYTVADQLTLRGAFSTGFRAPTPGQANVVTITTSFDGVTGEQVQEGTVSPTNPLAQSLGGKALTPETSTNLSIGLASRLTDNLSLTLDYYSIDVDDRIIKSRSLPINNPLFSELAFYTNSLNTSTSGIDAVVSWRLKNTNVSFAYNYNKTEVVSQEQVGGEDPVSDGTIFNLENNLPTSRASLAINHDFGKLTGMIRANYYGSTIDERGTKEEVSAETLIDVELAYPATDQLQLILGANNILDNYPDMIDTRLSQGMPFPRRTPIGYHGGMVYFKAVYKM
ncbi:MAG: TonB-dependent receptor, partial [Saprospiraceae bacterium]|nr:TonB-dependent receptor [Saprospiraceae bacterium]